MLPLTDLGPLDTAGDAKRWMKLVGRWSAAGEIHPEVARAAIRRVREWRRQRERGD